MSDELPFAGEPADSHEAIMRATFCALQEYGYAGLSIQRIADKSDLSKSTFYHHFDDKDDLLISFQEFILDKFNTVFQFESTGDPEHDVRTFIDLLLGDFPAPADAPTSEEVLSTHIEMRAQGVSNADFRAKFTETDQQFTEQFAELIEDGIEQGVFADVDAEQTAHFLLTVLEGTVLKEVTTNNNTIPKVREALDQYIEKALLVDSTPVSQ